MIAQKRPTRGIGMSLLVVVALVIAACGGSSGSTSTQARAPTHTVTHVVTHLVRRSKPKPASTTPTTTPATTPTTSNGVTKCGSLPGGGYTYPNITVYTQLASTCAAAMKVYTDLEHKNVQATHLNTDTAQQYILVDGWQCGGGNMDAQACWITNGKQIWAIAPGGTAPTAEDFTPPSQSTVPNSSSSSSNVVRLTGEDLNPKDNKAAPCISANVEVGPHASCQLAQELEQGIAMGKQTQTLWSGTENITYSCSEIGTSPGRVRAGVYRCVSEGDSQDWVEFAFT